MGELRAHYIPKIEHEKKWQIIRRLQWIQGPGKMPLVSKVISILLRLANPQLLFEYLVAATNHCCNNLRWR